MAFVAYIGIGSNQPLGDRSSEQIVAAAMEEMATVGRVTASSSLYRTAPVGFAAQPPFVNAAVEVETLLDPEELLGALIAMERRYGRDRAGGIPKGPRTLDLDLLLVDLLLVDSELGGPVFRNTAQLTLPHPEVANRRFVLAPLAEIAPTLRHPGAGRTIAELLAELPSVGANSTGAVIVLGRGAGERP